MFPVPWPSDCAIRLVWVGGGANIHGLKRLQCGPLYADVRSDLSGPFPFQLLAEREGRWHQNLF